MLPEKNLKTNIFFRNFWKSQTKKTENIGKLFHVSRKRAKPKRNHTKPIPNRPQTDPKKSPNRSRNDPTPTPNRSHTDPKQTNNATQKHIKTKQLCYVDTDLTQINSDFVHCLSSPYYVCCPITNEHKLHTCTASNGRSWNTPLASSSPSGPA